MSEICLFTGNTTVTLRMVWGDLQAGQLENLQQGITDSTVGAGYGFVWYNGKVMLGKVKWKRSQVPDMHGCPTRLTFQRYPTSQFKCMSTSSKLTTNPRAPLGENFREKLDFWTGLCNIPDKNRILGIRRHPWVKLGIKTRIFGADKNVMPSDQAFGPMLFLQSCKCYVNMKK
ncbi:hypothetical protein BDQ17DRAFT_1329554 [Cyathus striatus]|nr:hypothetical protein BDQ17DRAFT_1329554 [Cyathus striatus]